jgi:signal transduction histidine kinase
MVATMTRNNPSRPGHLGLLAMRERAEMAGGTWSIRSETGAGTTVTFRLPMSQD